MSNYLPFFRKYRPQSFKDIVGQENLVKALSNAIELNSIAHAYLFCGPRGTGKTSSARIFAKSLNCVNAPTLEPCQKCQSCIDITNSTGIDVVEIDAATNRGIDDAKELIEQTQYAPMSGKYKIFIIDEVHMLTPQAFNALLKTLEEPPENVIFILATTEPHKVLETIVSRCQRFDFKRITIQDIVKKLRQVSDLEKIKITDDALLTIATNVSGGLRDSLALLDQVSVLGAKETIDKNTIENLIGKITFNKLFNLLLNLRSFDLEKSFEIVQNIYKEGAEPKNLADNLISFLSDVILVSQTKDIENLKFMNLNSEEIKKIKDAGFEKSILMRFLNKAIEYSKEIKNASNPYLWVELMIIQMCCENNSEVLKSADIIEPAKKEVIKEIPQIETPINSEYNAVKKEDIPRIEETEDKTPEPPPEIEEPEEAPPIKYSDDNVDVWSKIVSSIESVPAKCFFSDVAKFVKCDDASITIGFLNQNGITMAKSQSKVKALENAIKNVFDKNLEVEYIQVSPNDNFKEAHIQKQPVQKVQTNPVDVKDYTPQKEAKEEKKTALKRVYTPKTQEMLDAFGGKIID